MKSIFDKSIQEELINRINSLDHTRSPQWGKMNVFQMLKHCTLWEDMILGNIKVKRMFAGLIFGRIALRQVLKDDSPLRRNSPSSPALIITTKEGDAQQQKQEWIKRIISYENYNNPNFIHPFFGKMSKEQVGRFVYKHTDHHLRQFGV